MRISATRERSSFRRLVAPRAASLAALPARCPIPCNGFLLVLLAIVALPAFAQDFPKLKPGLWEMERAPDQSAASRPNRPPPPANRTTMCLDESVQRDMFALAAGSMKGQCSRHDFKRSGNRLTGDFVCDVGGSRMHSRSTLVLDGNTAYRTEIDTTYDPPFMGQARSRMVMRAHNVGPCKPGQRPGDVVMPNGHTMNMRDLMNGPHGAQGTIAPGTTTPNMPR